MNMNRKALPFSVVAAAIGLMLFLNSQARADVLVAGGESGAASYITRLTNSGAVETNWSISGGPALSTVQFDGLAVAGNTIYAADCSSGSIYEYNLSTGAFAGTLITGAASGGAGPIQVAGPLKYNNGLLYVNDLGGSTYTSLQWVWHWWRNSDQHRRYFHHRRSDQRRTVGGICRLWHSCSAQPASGRSESAHGRWFGPFRRRQS